MEKTGRRHLGSVSRAFLFLSFEVRDIARCVVFAPPCLSGSEAARFFEPGKGGEEGEFLICCLDDGIRQGEGGKEDEFITGILGWFGPGQ